MHRPIPDQNPTTWRISARRGTLSVVLWAFGLATTLLLVGLWGRAVTHDQPTIQASARSAVSAELATDRIYGWIEDAVVSSGDVDPTAAGQAMADFEDRPEVEAAIGALVDQFVTALFVEEGEAADVELTDTLAPIVPLIVSALAEHDQAIDEAVVAAALAQAEQIDLASGEAATIATVADDARSLLSVIVVLASLVLLSTGSSAVWLSADRPSMVRLLATRVVLSALSFLVLFRVGAWVLDPERGGGPIASGGSILLGSNAHVFLLVAAAGGVVASGIAWYVWHAKRMSRIRNDASDVDDDIRELVSA